MVARSLGRGPCDTSLRFLNVLALSLRRFVAGLGVGADGGFHGGMALQPDGGGGFPETDIEYGIAASPTCFLREAPERALGSERRMGRGGGILKFDEKQYTRPEVRVNHGVTLRLLNCEVFNVVSVPLPTARPM